MNTQNVSQATYSMEVSLQKSHPNAFQSALHVRDTQGNYVMASDSQILAEAERAIDFRYPTGTVFESPRASGEFFRAKLAGRERECFAVAFLNNQHQLLAYGELFNGTISAVEVHPREIAREALRINAAAVVLAHNHPSFSPEPSKADKTITVRIKDALALIGVRVLDHVVVAGNETTSMAERGFVNF